VFKFTGYREVNDGQYDFLAAVKCNLFFGFENMIAGFAGDVGAVAEQLVQLVERAFHALLFLNHDIKRAARI